MLIFIFILLMIIISSTKVQKPGEFNKDYISRDGTMPIKGIFVILIVLSHAKGYFISDMSGFMDEGYMKVQSHLGQMVVAMFLFYSGYGMMEQIKKREFSYVASIAKKRFPNLLLNYDIAVLLYIILAFATGGAPSFKNILLSLIAWDGIGNSSWYIFVTFVMYILTMISFAFIKKEKSHKLYAVNILILSVLSVAFVLLLKNAGKEHWWYDTALLFPLGFWYSYFKKPVEKVIMKNDMSYIISAVCVTVLYIIAYSNRKGNVWLYFLFGTMFVLAVVVFTMKFKVESVILNWFGKHIFGIYILQRIPMIILDKAGLSHSNRYVFLILSFAITCAICEIYDTLYGKLSAKIWKKAK